MPSLDLLLELRHLKRVPRAGWLRVGATHVESVADHSWGVAWLVLVLLPEDLDRERALAYAVLHDVAEVRTGDITPYDGVSADEKKRRESLAMEGLLGQSVPALQDMWREYALQADEESRFVRQLDRLELALEALALAEEGEPGMEQFLISAEEYVTDPRLRTYLVEIRHRMESIGRGRA
ncbi:MAG: HD domain-containing protein [Myxococcota bacterium]